MFFKKNNVERKDFDTTITLNDESGNEIIFNFLDFIEFEEKEYVILLPYDSDDKKIVIFEVLSDINSDTEKYIPVKDNSIFKIVYAIFKYHCKVDFDFLD